MSNFTGITPNNTQTKRSSYLREEFQHLPGIFANNCVLPNSDGSYGGKLIAWDGLQATFSPFEAVIGSKYHRQSNPVSIDLSPIKASLIYANKNISNNNVTPILGKIDAEIPPVDEHMVVQYTFNELGNPEDNTNKNNDIITMVGTTRIPGMFGYAREFDGIDDYMVSASVPDGIEGAVEREMILVFKPLRLTGIQQWVGIGSSSSRWMYITTSGTRLYTGWADSHNGDTGYDLEVGKVYVISYGYDGTKIIVKVNGNLVWTYEVALNTAASTIRFGSTFSGANWSKGVFYYFEMRNKMRTYEQNAAISNKMLFPCTYEGWLSQYPENDPTPGTHTYKFNETGGTLVADDELTMLGTATGTTVVDSEIGLGKARKFNGNGDYISFGNWAFPEAFTVIFVGIWHTHNSDFYLLENRSGGNGGLIYAPAGERKLSLLNVVGGTQQSNTAIPVDTPVFLAVTHSDGGSTRMYINSPIPDVEFTGLSFNKVACPMFFGRNSAGNRWTKATVEYYTIIPKELSKAEIAQKYNVLMKRGKRDIRDDVLSDKINQMPLAFVQTNETELIMYDDESWMYGRRDDYRNGFGNRKVFLGWKYYNTGGSNNITLQWENPFGTRKIKPYYTWAIDANGTHESGVHDVYTSDDNQYGLRNINTITNRLSVMALKSGACFFNGSWQLSGYVGCYAEVIFND